MAKKDGTQIKSDAGYSKAGQQITQEDAKDLQARTLTPQPMSDSVCLLSNLVSPQGQASLIQNGPQVQNGSPCMETMARSTFEGDEQKPADAMTDQDCDGIVKIFSQGAVVGKHTDSVIIKKEKMWTCFPVLNRKTDRLNKIFQCNLCQKRFDKVSNVIDHIKTHTNERPYQCSICDKSFAQKGNRDRHEKKQSCQKVSKSHEL